MLEGLDGEGCGKVVHSGDRFMRGGGARWCGDSTELEGSLVMED